MPSPSGHPKNQAGILRYKHAIAYQLPSMMTPVLVIRSNTDNLAQAIRMKDLRRTCITQIIII